MGISADIIRRSHIEDNSKTLFNERRKSSLLVKGEGRYARMNRIAVATEGFAAITYSFSPSFSFISRKRDMKFA